MKLISIDANKQIFEVQFARRTVGRVSAFKDGFIYKTIFGDAPSVYYKSKNIAANIMIQRHRSDFTPVKNGGKWEHNLKKLNK